MRKVENTGKILLMHNGIMWRSLTQMLSKSEQKCRNDGKISFTPLIIKWAVTAPIFTELYCST